MEGQVETQCGQSPTAAAPDDPGVLPDYALRTKTQFVECPPPIEQGGYRFPFASGIVCPGCVAHL